MFKAIRDWLFGNSCVVYIATPMTNRDQAWLVNHAIFMGQVLRAYNLTPISPVLEENVRAIPEPLENTDRARLAGYWKRDKEIIRYEAHVTLLDGADEGSVGLAREQGLARYCLWRPTVTLWTKDRGLSVAHFEDDAVFLSAHSAAAYIDQHYSSRVKRWKWRAQMLARTLPGWIVGQLYGWR